MKTIVRKAGNGIALALVAPIPTAVAGTVAIFNATGMQGIQATSVATAALSAAGLKVGEATFLFNGKQYVSAVTIPGNTPTALFVSIYQTQATGVVSLTAAGNVLIGWCVNPGVFNGLNTIAEMLHV